MLDGFDKVEKVFQKFNVVSGVNNIEIDTPDSQNPFKDPEEVERKMFENYESLKNKKKPEKMMSLEDLVHRSLHSLHANMCQQISDLSSDVISYLTDKVYFSNVGELGESLGKSKALDFELDALNVFNNECQRTYQYLLDQKEDAERLVRKNSLSIRSRSDTPKDLLNSKKMTKSGALLKEMQDLTSLIIDGDNLLVLQRSTINSQLIYPVSSHEVLGQMDGNLKNIFGSQGMTSNLVYPVEPESDKKTFQNIPVNNLSSQLPQMFREMSSNSIPIIRAASIKLLNHDDDDVISETTEILGEVSTPASSLRDFEVIKLQKMSSSKEKLNFTASEIDSKSDRIFGAYQNFMCEKRDADGNFYCKIIKNDKFNK